MSDSQRRAGFLLVDLNKSSEQGAQVIADKLILVPWFPERSFAPVWVR